MPLLSVDVVTDMAGSQCLDCSTPFRVAIGAQQPVPGAFMLCSACAALHILDGDRIARRPTEAEAAFAATSPALEEWRQIILAAPYRLFPTVE